MSGILCLKWNNHTTTFIKALDILRSKELYCDATIACHGKYYPVHRFVLTTCSEYFEEIFERTQCKHPFIIVKDVEELQLEALLNYMYKGEVNVLQERLPGLIRAAEALKIKGLAVSEDSTEETKPTKEKRKSNSSSSPLQPKSKKKPEKNSNQSKRTVESDDDIQEVDSQNSRPSKKGNNSSIANSSQVPPLGALQKSNFQNNVEQHGDENEMEDIKIEPTEICENAEDDFVTNSNENQSQTNEKEDSLFVSLLSPNDTHSLSQELMDMNDRDNEALPQCSTWNDDVSNNSDKTQDEMDPMNMKPMVTMEEGTFSNLCLGSDDQIEGEGSFLTNPAMNAMNAIALLNFPHHCPHCNHRSKTKQELLRHVSYYHSDFRFSCTLCHYKCRTNGLLKKHMLKHTKEKPYSCSVCSYKTARKQHLVRHAKLHTGEKPFSCPICAYKASRKDRLREHLRKHRELINLKYE